MERVIVTVKREDEARVRDLDVPADVEAGRLAELIAGALQWEMDRAGQPVRYGVEARPLGRALRASETLSDAGVWDGSWLVLRPLGERGGFTPSPAPDTPLPPGPRGPAPQPDTGGPVTGWRSLDLPSSPQQDGAQEETPDDEVGSADKFVWRQLD